MKSNSQIEADLIVEIVNIDIINSSILVNTHNMNYLFKEKKEADVDVVAYKGRNKLDTVDSGCCFCCLSKRIGGRGRVGDGGSGGGGRVCSLIDTSQSYLIINVNKTFFVFCCCF